MSTSAIEMTRKKNKDYRNREYLRPDEVAKLLVAARDSGRNGDRNYAIILIMFRHALRVSEAAGLCWTDVDFEGKTINIQRCKGSNSGVHPMQPDEIAALKKLKIVPGIPQVFVNERGQSFVKESIDENLNLGIGRMISRVGDRTNIGMSIHSHMLRHSCGYTLANKGYDLRLIQDWMGHQNIQNTVWYTTLAPDRFLAISWQELGIAKIPDRIENTEPNMRHLRFDWKD